MATITEIFKHASTCKNCSEDYKHLTIDGQSALNIFCEYARVRQLIQKNGIKDKEELSILAWQWEYVQLAVDVLSKKMSVKELSRCVKIASCTLQTSNHSKL